MYDVAANDGFVSVGVDHDTPVFGVTSIEAWWNCGPASATSLIGDTANRGGLVVCARLDRRRSATGKKVTDKEFRELKIEPNTFHGDWNYVIRPRTADVDRRTYPFAGPKSL